MKPHSDSAPPELTLIALCDQPLVLRGAGVVTRLRLLRERIAPGTRAQGAGARYYLTLEQVRGSFDAAVLRLHLTAPQGVQHEEIFLGSVGLYGLRLASIPAADGSSGMKQQLDVTAHARAIEAAMGEHSAGLRLAIRPQQALPDGVEIGIERIGLYRLS